MFFFEFEHELSGKDLQNIWQNIMPKVGITIEHQEATAELSLREVNILHNEDIRWLVFKVKKRAKQIYFHSSITMEAIENYDFTTSYNWPYDYFSLIELAKIDVDVKFENKNLPPSEETGTSSGSPGTTVATNPFTGDQVTVQTQDSTPSASPATAAPATPTNYGGF